MNKNIKNSYKILSVLSLAVLISCSGSDMSSSSSDEGPIYKGPYYNEFLMCNAGSDFTEENVSEMMTAYKELPVPDGLGWSGIYSPVGEDHRYSNGWWELEWTSKESADEAWNNPSAEFLAWAEKYEEVISCDGEGRFPWTFYLPRPADSFGPVMGEDGYFASEFLACNYKEGKSGPDLRASVIEFNEYLDNNESSGPYFFGVYLPRFDEATSDFLWGNWHASFDGMKAGKENFAENGKAMQAKFDEISTCLSPDYYDSWELINIPN